MMRLYSSGISYNSNLFPSHLSVADRDSSEDCSDLDDAAASPPGMTTTRWSLDRHDMRVSSSPLLPNSLHSLML